MTILYDATVNDIIFHDISNNTWNSISRVYGTFDNSILLQVSSSLRFIMQSRAKLFVWRRC